MASETPPGGVSKGPSEPAIAGVHGAVPIVLLANANRQEIFPRVSQVTMKDHHDFRSGTNLAQVAIIDGQVVALLP
jgi:hypothetical protein